MHMRHLVSGLLTLGCLAPAGTSGQDAAASPDLRRLDFYVGRWSEAGQMREDPTKPFKPISGSETCSWAAGNFAVTCEEKTSGEGGGWEGVYILGYDPASRQYHVHGIEKPGTSVHGVGQIEGDRWVWVTDPAPDGSQLRYTFAPAGAGARTLVVEALVEDSYLQIANITYTPRK
jgi:hypothetical protein